MENITLGEIEATILFLVSLIGGVEFLAFRMRKWLQKEIQPLKDELNENSLNTMKNTICNEMIPLSERVSVGKKYVDKGGNGAVKVYLHQLEQEYEEELKKGGK